MASAPFHAAPGSHPIHGLLGAYPLALFSAALVTDIVYMNSAQMMWANFSIWLITGGLIMGGAAVVAGIVDALAHRRRGARRRLPWWHTLATIFLFAFALVNAFVHSRDAYTSVVPSGIILSAIVTVLAIVTSWTGFALLGRERGTY